MKTQTCNLLKTLIVILALQCFSFKETKSQNMAWATIGTKWYYDYHNPVSRIGYVKYEVEKDTLINNIVCNKISVENHGYNYQSANISSFNSAPLFTYEEDSVVYIYFENDFDTLANFKANIGDKWKQPRTICNSQETMYFIVTGKGQKNINGEMFDWISVDYNTWMPVQDTIFNKIGTVKFAFGLYDFCGESIHLDLTLPTELRCYSDSTFHYNKTNNACDYFYTNTDFEMLKNTIIIYPNPNNGLFYIDVKNESLKNEKAILKIYDYYGKKILEKEGSLNNLQAINLKQYSKGIYLLSIEVKDKVYTEKIILH